MSKDWKSRQPEEQEEDTHAWKRIKEPCWAHYIEEGHSPVAIVTFGIYNAVEFSQTFIVSAPEEDQGCPKK